MPLRVAVATLAIAACAIDEDRRPDDIDKEGIVTMPAPINRDIDVLLVVDRSAAMTPYQEVLAAHAPVLAGALRLPDLEAGPVIFPESLANVHIAVVAGDGGELVVGDERCRPDDADFVRDVALFTGGRDRNFAGPLDEAIACNALVGTEGVAPQAPLEAMRDALGDSGSMFLRENAYLAVVVVAAGDDESPAAVAEYVDFLKGLKADDSLLFVSTITGGPSPRFDELRGQFPNRSVSASIDSPDWTSALELGRLVKMPLLGRCLSFDLLDVAPDAPGVQFECVASELVGNRDDGFDEIRQLVYCDGEPIDPPCWEMVANPMACPEAPGHLELRVHRGDASIPPDFHVQLRCRTE